MDRCDYIVVGAGSAGCIVANRLSADPRNRVVLIEGGPPDRSKLISMPRGFARLLGHKIYSYMYPTARPGTNGAEVQIRGRTLGGSSSINGMIYMRGIPSDFDEWDCPGWAWDDVLKSFKAIEHHEDGETPLRGGHGELRISSGELDIPICDDFMAALGNFGVPRVKDINSVDGECTGYNARNIWRGRRQSSSVAFLKPIRNRANLEVITEAEVERVLFEGHRAVGVRLHKDGQVRDIKADREIVLSAGAIRTPKMLQLSGIGPGEHLASLGIPVLVDSPEVGGNLADHRVVILQYGVSHGSENHQFAGWRLYKNVIEQTLLGTGPMSHCAYEVGTYIKSRAGLDRPDVLMCMGPFAQDFTVQPLAMQKRPSVSMGCWQMRPESRGTIRLQSANFRENPQINLAYLDTEEDRRVVVDAIRLSRKAFDQPQMAKYGPVELLPGANFQSDDELLAVARESSGSVLHMSGTCAMGTSATSALDPQLRVRGVTGLRVADVSIMPTINSGNTNAPAMAIGQRAAEIILAG